MRVPAFQDVATVPSEHGRIFQMAQSAGVEEGKE
jgi:hypothetical protein